MSVVKHPIDGTATLATTDDQLRSIILTLLGQRAETSSICPSEAARAVSSVQAQWRALMPQVRSVAFAMAAEHVVQVTGRGEVLLGESEGRGAIRIARGPAFQGPNFSR